MLPVEANTKKQVLSQAQQKYESQVLPAKRGDIYDKNGNILATSNKVYNVILDCKTVNSDEDYVEPTIRALNEVLGIDEETVRSLLADSRTSQSQYQVLTKQLSMDKKKEFGKNIRQRMKIPVLLKRRQRNGQISKASGLKRII